MLFELVISRQLHYICSSSCHLKMQTLSNGHVGFHKNHLQDTCKHKKLECGSETGHWTYIGHAMWSSYMAFINRLDTKIGTLSTNKQPTQESSPARVQPDKWLTTHMKHIWLWTNYFALHDQAPPCLGLLWTM